MNALASITAIALSTVLLVAARPSACSCVPPGPPEAEFERADQVFAGEVESISTVGEHLLAVRLRIIRGFKGATTGGTITVRTASDSAACGYDFVRGGAYLVYAGESNGLPHVSLCSRTVELNRASEDLEALDALELLDHRSGDDGGCGGTTNLGMIQAAAFSLLTVGFLKRRRRVSSSSRV